MKAYATKLVDLTEHHAEEMAGHWVSDVRRNRRTPSYNYIPEGKLIGQAITFYRNFREMFFTDNPFEVARVYFRQYAEERFEEKIPLKEAMYALVLMRRHLWLYAEFQTIFITAIEQQQAVETLNRTILMFDYAAYLITERYQELMTREIDDRFGRLRDFVMLKASPGRQAFRLGIMALCIIGAAAITYYYHVVLKNEALFSHLFYIPVIFGCIWWGRRGLIVPILLAGILLLSHHIFMNAQPIMDDSIRAVMLLVIGLVVALLTEGLTRVGALLGDFV
ncbi:MAG: hypothetical protein ABSB79_10805 [Syntrophales bacterium]|jgi:hypothetical protein